MEAYGKPAIAGVHLEFADGFDVFPSVPGKSDSTTARRRHGEDKPRVHACPLLSQTCPTLQSKENDHEPPTHAYETGESPTRVVAG